MTRIHEALTKAAQEDPAAQADTLFLLGSTLLTKPESKDATPYGLRSHGRMNVPPPPSTDPPELDDLRKRCSYPEWSLDPALDVFSDPGWSAVGAEQFRTLRSRLYQLRGNRPVRTILITSAVAAEGKSFVAFNLAQAIIRQPGQRVLIIDADLRCSRLHRIFGAPNILGLSDYLGGKADEIAIIQSSHEGNLFLIPSGTRIANPSELLANGRFKRLIERAAPLFDWIIVDSPPCLPVTDANIVANSCDGLLLVVKAYSTPAETAQSARQELQDRNILGVVLNFGSQFHRLAKEGVGPEVINDWFEGAS